MSNELQYNHKMYMPFSLRTLLSFLMQIKVVRTAVISTDTYEVTVL
jgi:hypothetical protein